MMFRLSISIENNRLVPVVTNFRLKAALRTSGLLLLEQLSRTQNLKGCSFRLLANALKLVGRRRQELLALVSCLSFLSMPVASKQVSATSSRQPITFVDVTKAAGINFSSFSAPDKKYIVESRGVESRYSTSMAMGGSTFTWSILTPSTQRWRNARGRLPHFIAISAMALSRTLRPRPALPIPGGPWA
jgi:hypothetical protein